MPNQRLPKTCRLRSPADFRRVYDRRRSVTNGPITLCACENDLDYVRFGVSVSRKVGGAVARNRWKRLLREAFRACRANLPPGIDVVVIAREPTPPTLDRLLEELPRLASQVARKLKK